MPYLGHNLGMQWPKLVSGGVWTPDRLNPLQGLSSISGTEAIDQTTNELDLDVLGVNIATTDGVGDVFDTGVVFDYHQAFTATFRYKTTDNTGCLIGQMDSVSLSEFVLVQVNGKLSCSVGTVFGTETSFTYDDGEWHTVEVTYNGTSGSFTVDGGDETAIDTGTTTTSSTTSICARRGTVDTFTYFLAAGVCDAEVSFADGTGFHYVFEGGAGSDGYDISGNDNRGRWAGTLATIHGSTADDIESYNLTNGCSKIVNFNGTDANFDTGLLTTLDTKVVIRARYNELVNYRKLFGSQTGDRFSIGINDSEEFYVLAGGVSLVMTGADTDWHTFTFDPQNEVASVDSAETTISSTVEVGAPLTIASAGSGNYSDCSIAWVKIYVNGVLVRDYDFFNDYGTNVQDNVTSNLAAMGTTEFLYIPALSDGTDDAEGLGLTNPGGSVANNCEVTYQQKAANTEFLDNTFWSADGLSYDEKTFADLIEHIDLDDWVVVVGDSPLISDIITFAQNKELTPSEYTAFINWLAAQGDSGEHLIPYEVTSGGIGAGGTWYTADGIHIYLVEDA